MTNYLVSHEADQDLLYIALYGVENYGVENALDYRDRLIRKFKSISERPLQFPQIAHIHPGYRRCVFGAHSIYFRIRGNSIEIVRILGRQDTAILRSSN